MIDRIQMMNNNLDKIFDAIRSLTTRPEAKSLQPSEINGATFLIVGLGNPGREYRDTRHNIGFMVVDQLAGRMNISFNRAKSKALITDGRYQGLKIILAKPQTFMNKSGHPTSSLLKFYKLTPKNLLVVYDDVDLPFDTIRIKPSGGSAGHKGMRSIIEQLGTDEFPRLRMGVGRPAGGKQAANYVLKPFNKEETEILDIYLARAADATQAFLTHGIDYAMTKYN